MRSKTKIATVTTGKPKRSRLHNPETGKLDLIKIGKLAGAITAIIVLLGTVGGGLWKAFQLIETIEKLETATVSCQTQLDELELDPGHNARHRLAEAIRTVDRESRNRDGVNARVVAVIENTVDVLHGGTYQPVIGGGVGAAGGSGELPVSRAAQIARAREDAVRAATQAQETMSETPAGEDPLADLDEL